MKATYQHHVTVVTLTCTYMYLSSNVTQWHVANCTIVSIPPLPISFVKSSGIKGELKQTATEVELSGSVM